MNITAKRIALFSALSEKIRNDELIVIDDIKVEAPKTKEMVKVLDAFKLDKTVLVVIANNDEMVKRATSNLQKVSLTAVELINTYDVVKNAKLLISKQAIEKLAEVYGV